jgi:hypothetical protein
VPSGFNADDYRAALRPWTFTVGGLTWEARPVSAPAVVSFHARFAAIADAERDALLGSPDEANAIHARAEIERRKVLRALLRLAFPMKLPYRWRGDPVDKILALDPPTRNATLADFFAWAAERAGLTLPPRTPTTPGPPSSPPSGTK